LANPHGGTFEQGAVNAFVPTLPAKKVAQWKYDGFLSPFPLLDEEELQVCRQGVERYDAALQQLSATDREAIIGRLELQYDYQELAVMLGKPTANAARVAVTRALARLVEMLDDEA